MLMTRRNFVKGVACGMAAAGAGLPMSSTSAKAASPNEKFVVAHIGVGGMGMAHLNWFAAFPDVETAAICDVDSNKAQNALNKLKELRPDTKAVVENDFRRLLERKDIDVITYATPDHWHALNAISSFQAGKHVYGEKPLSYDAAEGQAMAKACKKYGKVFQLGTQIHAGDNYHRVVEIVRSGVLGKIHTIRLWRVGSNMESGFVPDSDPPAHVDWNMWLGPAPYRQYNSFICSPSYRYFWDYSTGVFGDFWCHVADLPYWALGLDDPISVKATGEDPIDNMIMTPGFMDVELEYKDLKMTWHSRVPDIKGANDRYLGIQFVGTNGEMVADYNVKTIFMDGREMDDIPDVPQSIPRSPGHQRNFLDCIKSGGVPESNIEHAAKMSLPMHLACISYRLGRKLTWDSAKYQFVGDEAANRMLHRPYREPWELKI